jgi:hypothetical protein
MYEVFNLVISWKKIESWVLLWFTRRVIFGSCYFDLLVDGSKAYFFTCVVESLTPHSTIKL